MAGSCALWQHPTWGVVNLPKGRMKDRQLERDWACNERSSRFIRTQLLYSPTPPALQTSPLALPTLLTAAK
jgi:hypothetical protein